MFLNKNDNNLLPECVHLKDDHDFLCKEIKNVLKEQTEEFLDYIKKEEFIMEKTLNKSIENYFATMFEDIRHERWLIVLLSLTDPDILGKQIHSS